MQDFISFIIDNWMLVLLFFMVIFLIFMEEVQSNQGSSGGVESGELSQLIHKGYKVIDLRDPQSFSKGCIQGAKNMSSDKIEKLNFNNVDADKWILCCKNGKISSELTKSMNEKHSLKLQYLIGGIESWKGSGFTLENK